MEAAPTVGMIVNIAAVTGEMKRYGIAVSTARGPEQ